MNSLALASIACAYAEKHYGDKDARFDVIVECMSVAEIMEALEEASIISQAGAIKWAKQLARGHHEQELNQAWDGPESCVGSSKYEPDADGIQIEPSYAERLLREEEDAAEHSERVWQARMGGDMEAF